MRKQTGKRAISIFFNGDTTMNESLNLVRDWLEEMPFQDNYQFVAKDSPSTWSEWIDKGKSIENAEQNLIWLLKNEDNDIIRSRAAISLGFIGSKRCIIPLINSLDTDIALIQMEAAAALGRLGYIEAVDELCEAMKSDDANVRANVCIALDKIGGGKARRCLKSALSDKDSFVQDVLKEIMGE